MGVFPVGLSFVDPFIRDSPPFSFFSSPTLKNSRSSGCLPAVRDSGEMGDWLSSSFFFFFPFLPLVSAGIVAKHPCPLGCDQAEGRAVGLFFFPLPPEEETLPGKERLSDDLSHISPFFPP